MSVLKIRFLGNVPVPDPEGEPVVEELPAFGGLVELGSDAVEGVKGVASGESWDIGEFELPSERPIEPTTCCSGSYGIKTASLQFYCQTRMCV